MDSKQLAMEDSARWRILLFISLVLAFSISTWFSASAVVPQLRLEWGLSPSAAAWLTIAVQLGFVAGAVLSSLLNLSDLISTRYVIMAGSLGTGLANALLLLVNGPALGIPLRFFTGFFIAAVYPPGFKLVSTWFKKQRGLALGIAAAAIVFGNGSPHLVNGLGGLEWRVVIVVTSLLALSGALIAAFLLREGPHPFPEANFDPRQIGLALKNRGVRLATFGYLGHMWELFAMVAWILVFFGEAFDLHGLQSKSAPAFATFGVFVVGALGSWLGGFLADRWGRTNTTILLMAISGSCALTIGLVYQASLALTLFIAFIWGLTIVGDSAQFSTMVTETADQSYVGTALTVQLAAGFAVTVVTIWLLPYLQQWFSWRWAFALLAPGPAFGIWAMLRLKASPDIAKIGGGMG
jgi:MFS family permease